MLVGGEFDALGDGTPVSYIASWSASTGMWARVPVGGASSFGVNSAIYAMLPWNSAVVVAGVDR